MRIHPYAILFGVIIGVVGLDYFFKNKSKIDQDDK